MTSKPSPEKERREVARFDVGFVDTLEDRTEASLVLVQLSHSATVRAFTSSRRYISASIWDSRRKWVWDRQHWRDIQLGWVSIGETRRSSGVVDLR